MRLHQEYMSWCLGICSSFMYNFSTELNSSNKCCEQLEHTEMEIADKCKYLIINEAILFSEFEWYNHRGKFIQIFGLSLNN